MKTCPYCALMHDGKCFMVKEIEYFENGGVKRVQFYSPNDYVPHMAVPLSMPFNMTVLPQLPSPNTWSPFPPIDRMGRPIH